MGSTGAAVAWAEIDLGEERTASEAKRWSLTIQAAPPSVPIADSTECRVPLPDLAERRARQWCAFVASLDHERTRVDLQVFRHEERKPARIAPLEAHTVHAGETRQTSDAAAVEADAPGISNGCRETEELLKTGTSVGKQPLVGVSANGLVV